ncbi:bifunctional metallophosphatase/5'-nucleotidase [Virgibacillus sp. W0430]|uniref:bifunctional metallophosphatase/5'-nucleotidase n=1 Tax=Virgibacillus sp. W0430 TaxID=3391580 RepID=UPI003F46A9EA
MQEKMFIYFTNDLHSYFNNWSRVAAYLKEKKAFHKAENTSHWLADVGDHIDRVHPIAEAFMGKANVQLMNELKYDIATIGNNEGITLAHNDLFHLYDEAQFQIICSNLQSLTSYEPNWLQSDTILTSIGGVTIGVIGLTAPFNAYYNLLDWHVEAPFSTLKKIMNRAKENADVIVLLSHLGINEDREIARRFPDIDVIIGGHTHHLLRTEEQVNNTIITAAGKHCSFIGEVVLTWDHLQKKLIKKEAYTTDITHLAKDLPTEQLLLDLGEQADEQLAHPVIHIKNPIEVNWFQPTLIMQQLTNTLKQWTGAHIAMLNAGLLLDFLPAGTVTYKDIHRICPHPINPCVVKLTGSEILEVIRASLTKEFMELKLKGFGFRGEVLGRMVFSGVQVTTDFHENGQEFVKEVTFQGHSLRPDKAYTVATADTFTFGRLLPEIAKSKVKKFFLPEFIRDLLLETLKKNAPHTFN